MFGNLESIDWTTIAGVGSAFFAAVSSICAFINVKLARQVVFDQTEPKIFVTVCDDRDRPTIILIRIQNTGRETATDVQFKMSRSIPIRAWGLSVETAKEPDVLSDGPLINGIPALGPGEIREITWGQIGGLMKAIGDKPIDIAYTYRHGNRELNGQTQLEVASYMGVDASQKPALVAVDQLKKDRNSLREVIVDFQEY